MKLPLDAIISPEKIENYLLVPQSKGDKSQFLALGGYIRGTSDQLLQDLRSQVLPNDAVFEEMHEYGTKYRIYGTLTGPSGRSLNVVSVWMKEHLSGTTKFITLFPDKNRT